MSAVTIKYLLIGLLLFHSTTSLRFHKAQEQHTVWQQVAGQRLFVYSAFLDTRPLDRVRVRMVAAMKRRSGRAPLACHISFRDNRTYTSIAQIQILKEQHNATYCAAFVLCPVRGVNPFEMIGGVVSIVSQNMSGAPPGNHLTILSTEQTGREVGKIHACVAPLHSGLPLTNGFLMEWIELNRLLGVSHFHMYLHDVRVTDDVRCALARYQDTGVVQVRDWTLNLTGTEMGWSALELASLQDCVYRAMSSTEYLVLLGVAEVLLPRVNNTLIELLHFLRDNDPTLRGLPSAYTFQSVWFYTSWKDDPESPAPLVTSRKTLRTLPSAEPGARTRSLVRPRALQHLSARSAHGYTRTDSYGTVLSARAAMLHRYTAGCSPEEDARCVRVRGQRDRAAWRWTSALVRAVLEQATHIVSQGQCDV